MGLGELHDMAHESDFIKKLTILLQKSQQNNSVWDRVVWVVVSTLSSKM